MLGYVRAYKPDMTFRNFDVYKGLYCSLCKSIGKRYGLAARLTLSYDFVFFLLVRAGLRSECAALSRSRCSFNPAKKCLKCSLKNKDLQYTADVSMLMVYYKYLDNLDDSGAFKRFLLKLLSPYFRRIYKKAVRNCPDADEILKDMYFAQQDAEKGAAAIDSAAHPSAKALGSLLCLDSGYDDAETLYRFGYAVGRWVYLADAADDYEDDLKNGGFNPFISYPAEEERRKAQEAINLTAGEASSIFEKLKFNFYKSIISNIVYDGMYYSAKRIFDKKEGSERA